MGKVDDARQRDKRECRISRIHGRCIFAAMLVRVEPCDRSTAYRRKVKRDGSKARRRLDDVIVREAHDGTRGD